MPRTYPDRAAYDAACERLAAHLNTLDSTQCSLVYADGGTTDAGGQTWRPASERLVERAAWTTWFVEEHGAAALWAGGRWVPAEPSDDELSDLARGLWGEPGRDFGYPANPEPDRRIPLFSWVIETSDDDLGREDQAKIWQTADQGYSNVDEEPTETARGVLDAYLENQEPGGPITWDVRVMVWEQGHGEDETAATADVILYAGDTAGPDDLDTEYVSQNYEPRPGAMDTRCFWIAYPPHVLNYGHQADRIARAAGVGETEAAALAAARNPGGTQ